ncbi:hypothetical protein F4678DRAFT_357136 [Xylaria arbuscula]|nr:hypothetical protein F4678DRAFT_357136 [Xylaria arbuscula]
MDYPRHRQPSISSASSYQDSVFSGYSGASSSTVVTYPDPHEAYYAPTGGMFCEFVGYSSCGEVFATDDVEAWIEHIIFDHFHEKLPRQVDCWFCDDYQFNSEEVGDRLTNFRARMYHIRDHFFYERRTGNQMRPDYDLNEHLRKHKLISEESYNAVRRYAEAPQGPDIYRLDQLPSELQPRNEGVAVQFHNSQRERRHRHKHGKSKK